MTHVELCRSAFQPWAPITAQTILGRNHSECGLGATYGVVDGNRVVVRVAEAADIDAVFEIRTSVTENHLSYQQLVELGITQEAVLAMLADSPCLWIIEVDGTAAGFAMADIQAGSVFACFIRPQHQGRGLGRLLMQRAEEFLFQRHSTIWLTTTAGSRAFGFYDRLGWIAVQDLPCGSVRFEKHCTASIVTKMHDDEVYIDEHLVRRLLGAQFPHWASLPLTLVPSAGTDNAMYRLGDDLAVRLPKISGSVKSLRKEQHWLPQLAPHLPVPCPIPVGLGAPAKGWEWPWSICRWVDGETPTVGYLADPIRLAQDLAAFITALRAIDTVGGPPAYRGSPLAIQDQQVRAALTDLDGLIDVDTATLAWEEALGVPVYAGPPRWFHGDLSPFNLLTKAGGLAGVIDFGLIGVGDPSIDLIPAWNLLPAAAREQFRAALGVDDHAWARGRGWALSVALVALPYYQHTNPPLADNARHVIGEILVGDTV
ncbi:MAG: GNAT family N-acetyltransferase [Mycobacteriaceae bacterium]|nr:GNAT family N-acetyltransferase [Mycobacteriaceae bacterium]